MPAWEVPVFSAPKMMTAIKRLFLLRLLGFYSIVHEGTAKVFALFGNVLETITEPGIHFLWLKLGPAALIVNWIGAY